MSAEGLFQVEPVAQSFDKRESIFRSALPGGKRQFFVFSFAQLGWPAGLAINLPSSGPSPPPAALGARPRAANLTVLGAIFNGDSAGPGAEDPQLRNRYQLRINDPPLALMANCRWIKLTPRAMRWRRLVPVQNHGVWIGRDIGYRDFGEFCALYQCVKVRAVGIHDPEPVPRS
jgi:hypothetical protein